VNTTSLMTPAQVWEWWQANTSGLFIPGGVLGAVELKWPLIAAELDVVDAEIRLLTVTHPGELDWRRLRRAEHRRLRALAGLLRPNMPNMPNMPNTASGWRHEPVT